MSYVCYAWPADKREKVLAAAREVFLTDESVTYNDAAREALRQVYAKRINTKVVLRPDGSVTLPPEGQRPTLRQIAFLLKKVIPCSQAVSRRKGSADLRNDASPTTGSVMEDCAGPADVYEVDDTSFDIHAVSDDRSLILGKVTLNFVVDRGPRLIVAFYMTYDAPSWESAKQSFIRIATDWERASGWVLERVPPRQSYPRVSALVRQLRTSSLSVRRVNESLPRSVG